MADQSADEEHRSKSQAESEPNETVAAEPATKVNGAPAELEESEASSSRDTPPRLPFMIVGIGGSAGGLESYVKLLEHLPSDTGMTFVIVSHLSPDHKSDLVDILGRVTSMPVSETLQGVRPEPNHVYVVSTNAFVQLEQGAFQVEPASTTSVSHPVDHFFFSLAADQKNYALGVIFSGRNADGALGLKAIKGEGGITLVQAPGSARFPEMPRNSLSTDRADFVLAPEQIAEQLANIGHQFRSGDLGVLENGTLGASDEQAFFRILAMLRTVSGIDFRLYKQSTIQRRIARRMLLLRMPKLQEYLSHLQRNPAELRDLQEDTFISVTSFFRDGGTFESLKTAVFPKLFEDRPPDQQLRIWVAGCSTGEEVYSLAICLLEYLSSASVLEPSIQLFGTDASERNIAKARSAIYPETITREVSPERLRRFFVKTEKGFQVAKRVRDLCIFARQNLSQDPPFSRMDLISCRNVLIYFGTELQRQIIPVFHYALRPKGFLMLGHSETIREFGDLFSLSDRRYKIYSRRNASSSRSNGSNGIVRAYSPDLVKLTPSLPEEGSSETELQRTVDRIILTRFSPPAVLVNENLEIIQTRGHMAPYLEPPLGSSTLRLNRLAFAALFGPLTEAVHRAVDEDLPVQLPGLPIQGSEELGRVDIEVLPVRTVNTVQAKCFLILFTPAERTQDTSNVGRQSPELREDKDIVVAQLRQEVSTTRLYLQSLLEDREAKTQALISANEEIQSANEELQSTNEELETTKEELQSSNEELQTVNDELQHRNTVLTQASNDLSNLLNNVNLPVLMLDNSLNIRQFTPPTQKLMNLRPTDIGRPLREIRLNLQIEGLEEMLSEVLETLGSRELELRDADGRWYLLRVRPYRTADNKIEGLVVVLLEIDQLRRSQQQLRDARDFATAIIKAVPLPLVVVNFDLKIRSTNEAFCQLSGLSRSDLEGRHVTDLATSLWGLGEKLRMHLLELRDRGDDQNSFELNYRAASDEKKMLCLRGRVLHPDGEKALLLTVEDITTRTATETTLTGERESLKQEVQRIASELQRTQTEQRALTASLFTSQEEERRRVARELHDDISQQLAALEIELFNAQRHLPEQLRASSEISEMCEVLRERIGLLGSDVRRLSHGLHPSLLDDLGLAAALRSLTGDFGEREGMITTFSVQDAPESLPIEVATGIYRIAQEALRNVSKHAGKTHVKVNLRGIAEGLQLQITDAGHGFEQRPERTGLGLISMEERARLMEATLHVRSAIGEGTSVSVLVPLRRVSEGESS